MRYTIYHIIIGMLAVLLVCGACQDDLEGNPLNSNMLTLQLQTSAITRALEVGEDRFNENVVKEVDVYFFQESSGTATGNCMYAQTGLVPEGSTLQVELDRTILTNGNYFIYVVANYNLINETEAEGKSLVELQNIVLTTNWKEGYTEDESVIEESLAMDGSTIIEVTDKGATGHVDLTRAMAKIMLYVTTESEIKDNKGLTYEPVNARMFATLVYGVNKTNFAGNYAVQAGDENGSNSDYITRMRRDYDPTQTEEVTVTVTENGEEKQEKYNRYEQVAPFYSYPNPADTENRKDSYLILCVPWMVTEGEGVGGSYQAFNYYYRVPITGTNAPALLERNHYYKVNVHIGVLGSLSPHDAVEVEANFEIVDWFSAEIDADMQQYQYLVLDEYKSVMNNVNVLENPYFSSSELKMSGDSYGDTQYTRITSVTYPNYKDTNEDDYTSTVTLRGSQIANAGFTITENDGKLIFNHVVTSEDYVPYTITVEVWNTQGKHVTWEIKQYPAIYIVGDYNPNGEIYNGWNYEKGNRFVYGEWTGSVEDDGGNDLGGVNNFYTSSSSNTNPNQYTIYITSFDIEGSNYAIGDPRSQTIYNLDYLNKRDGRGGYLDQYYPTRKENVANVIAPAFKIASSWGVVSTSDAYDVIFIHYPRVLSYETAQRRCASYQENGYPAGRWRIPTEAEIEYIVSLSDRGVIPKLFDGDYYASSGRYYDNESSTSRFREDNDDSKGHAVRCVYDVWYWGNEKYFGENEEHYFVWGDDPKIEN